MSCFFFFKQKTAYEISACLVGSASGATATVTVTANIAWTATMSGDGFTISPQGGDNNGTVTVTATAANETSASKDLGSITFSGEGVTPLTLRVAQAAKPSAEPTRQAEISYAVFCLKKKKQYGVN